MSRPRKSADARLTRKIEFRLSQAAFDQLETQADKLGLSVHQLARQLAMSKSGKLQIQSIPKADPELIAQVKRLGVLVNQIAKRLHMTGRVSPHLDHICQQIEIVVMRAVDQEVPK